MLLRDGFYAVVDVQRTAMALVLIVKSHRASPSAVLNGILGKVSIHGFELPPSGTNGNLLPEIQCGISFLTSQSSD